MLTRIAAFGLASLVSACTGLPMGAQGPQQAILLDRAVALTAPAGYCADPQISRPGRGFAFLVACAVLDPDTQVALPGDFGLVTVQAGPADSATVAGAETDFLDFLRTEQGRTLLAAGDMSGPVAILASEMQTNRILLYTRDLDAPTIVGTQAESWRAFTDIAGRTVTVTVRGLSERPLSQARARSLLDATVANLAAVAKARTS